MHINPNSEPNVTTASTCKFILITDKRFAYRVKAERTIAKEAAVPTLGNILKRAIMTRRVILLTGRFRKHTHTHREFTLKWRHANARSLVNPPFCSPPLSSGAGGACASTQCRASALLYRHTVPLYVCVRMCVCVCGHP